MAQKSQRTGYFVQCENCGKEVYQTRTQYNRGKHHYCSYACQKEFQHKILYEDRECEVCQSLFHVRKKSKQRFCSPDCQKEWQKTNVGSKNPKFQGSIVTCDWCGMEYELGKDRLTKYTHHFCSVKCKQSWYSNVFSQSDEWKEESRIRATKLLKDNPTITNTKPQLIINNLLDKLKISYENEKECKYFSIDNYLTQYNLMIEVMGDFWHCSPLKYDKVDKDIHKRNVPRDKAKHTYIQKYYNIEILYLWEDDIYNRIDVCEKLIKEYVDNNGCLLDYNSFNYQIIDGNLELKDAIIKPHFDSKIA